MIYRPGDGFISAVSMATGLGRTERRETPCPDTGTRRRSAGRRMHSGAVTEATRDERQAAAQDGTPAAATGIEDTDTRPTGRPGHEEEAGMNLAELRLHRAPTGQRPKQSNCGPWRIESQAIWG